MGEEIVDSGGFGANKTPEGSFKNILKSVAVSLIVTFLILIIAALILCFTDFPEKYTFPSAIAATVIGVLAGSYGAARRNEANRMLAALTVAFIYAVLAYIIGCLIQGKFVLSTNTALFTVITLVTGAIAGILAGRAVKTPKKYKGGSNYFTDKFRKNSTKSYKFGKNSS